MTQRYVTKWLKKLIVGIIGNMIRWTCNKMRKIGGVRRLGAEFDRTWVRHFKSNTKFIWAKLRHEDLSRN